MGREVRDKTFFDRINSIRTRVWALPDNVSKESCLLLPTAGLRLSRLLPMLAGIDCAQPVETDEEIFERDAYLKNAFDTLATAAHSGLVILRGARGDRPAQDIQAAVFADPLTTVAGDDDAFGPDEDRWPNSGSWAGDLVSYENKVWRRVTVDRNSLAAWVAKRERERKEARPIVSDEEAMTVIREAMTTNGGFIGQNDGAEIVRAKFKDFNKKRAMALVKAMTGNDKAGPKGPRRNRAK